MKTTELFLQKNKLWLVISGIFVAFFLISVFIRVDQYDQYGNSINIENLDASYQVVSTVDAMQANTISVTKLLPIITFSKPLDKYIPWGATVEGKGGNYIYTSFPQGSFVQSPSTYTSRSANGSVLKGRASSKRRF